MDRKGDISKTQANGTCSDILDGTDELGRRAVSMLYDSTNLISMTGLRSSQPGDRTSINIKVLL